MTITTALVDGAELAAGLGSLCGGRHDVKVRLCFDLFDADNDGYLDEWEVRRYLRSVYRTAPGQDLLDEDGERVRPEDQLPQQLLPSYGRRTRMVMVV